MKMEISPALGPTLVCVMRRYDAVFRPRLSIAPAEGLARVTNAGR